MYKRIGLILTTVLALLFLTACVPTYQAESSEKTLLVNVADLQTPQLCINHTWYSLPKNQNGFTQVPYGHRIIIGDNFSLTESGGGITRYISCDPVLSFLPQKGHRYALFFMERLSHCYISVFRYKKNTRLGLVLEQSVRKSSC